MQRRLEIVDVALADAETAVGYGQIGCMLTVAGWQPGLVQGPDLVVVQSVRVQV